MHKFKKEVYSLFKKKILINNNNNNDSINKYFIQQILTDIKNDVQTPVIQHLKKRVCNRKFKCDRIHNEYFKKMLKEENYEWGQSLEMELICYLYPTLRSNIRIYYPVLDSYFRVQKIDGNDDVTNDNGDNDNQIVLKFTGYHYNVCSDSQPN